MGGAGVAVHPKKWVRAAKIEQRLPPTEQQDVQEPGVIGLCGEQPWGSPSSSGNTNAVDDKEQAMTLKPRMRPQQNWDDLFTKL